MTDIQFALFMAMLGVASIGVQYRLQKIAKAIRKHQREDVTK